MTFIADEGIEKQAVDRLRAGGHTVFYIAEQPPGITDEVVLDGSRRSRAVLLTSDNEFASMVVLNKRISAGAILLRLDGCTCEAKAALIQAAVVRHGSGLHGAYAVLTPESLRIRRAEI